ncbi:MAG: HAD-IB family phosphatase [Muribaculaceae bacterium]|nr:HAD-IB family phosphatase [Muribaculaceae bacterium]
MQQFIFLFDLDSTVTKQEILPMVARRVGIYERMCSLTENTMRGEIPFKQSFLQRVDLLRDIPVSEVRRTIAEIALNEKLVDFIRQNRDRSYIVTGNLDIWIEELMQRLGMEKNVYCSKALVRDDHIADVVSILDKNAVISQMVMPFVAVGDGNNDAEMIEAAEVGIGYGGVRSVAPSVMDCASHVICQEERLVSFLEKLV